MIKYIGGLGFEIIGFDFIVYRIAESGVGARVKCLEKRFDLGMLGLTLLQCIVEFLRLVKLVVSVKGHCSKLLRFGSGWLGQCLSLTQF